MIMANILASKYRPKIFDDIVGQKVPVTILKNSILQKKMHHAYIFAGFYGSGKTTSARVLAASENCINGPTITPCGVCENCKNIFSGKSCDVKEIDAASNRGIDDIRALKDEVMYAPMSCRTKYIIIDEVHGLSNIAVEALLKSIEEPPPCVRYILCTTNIHQIPLTIYSRCIVLNFSKVSWLEISDNLLKIAKKESINLDSSASKLIAKKSDGSVRTSINNLEKTVIYSKDVTIESLNKSLEIFDDSIFYNLFQFLAEKNLPSSFSDISNIINICNNKEEIISGLVSYIRKLIIIKVSKECPLEITQEDYKKLEIQSKLVKIGTLSKMIENIVNVKKGINVNIDFQALLENWCISSIILINKQNNE
jgi:DNA polymerase-3 subunit gamma/tau